MKEELVSFQVAKLAKEKGFNNNIIVGNVYDINPTQSLLQKWLREVHGYIVIVAPFYSITKYSVEVYGNGLGEEVPCPLSLTEVQQKRFNKYEDALEEGLQEALKLIKNIG